MKLYQEDEIFHPRYECSFDGCWCPKHESFEDYLDELAFSDEMDAYDREEFGGWGDDLG